MIHFYILNEILLLLCLSNINHLKNIKAIKKYDLRVKTYFNMLKI